MNTDENLTFSYPMPHGRQRFRELIVYIADKCRAAEYFGATKLNKILYHADFRAFERFGQPITGVTYFKLPKGPAPKALVPVRHELVNEGAIEIEERPIGNHVQKRVVPLREAYLDVFTKAEIALVDEVIRELWSQSAPEVSNASHDVRWRTLALRDEIPYEAVFLSDAGLTQNDIKRTRELADEFGWR